MQEWRPLKWQGNKREQKNELSTDAGFEVKKNGQKPRIGESLLKQGKEKEIDYPHTQGSPQVSGWEGGCLSNILILAQKESFQISNL